MAFSSNATPSTPGHSNSYERNNGDPRASTQTLSIDARNRASKTLGNTIKRSPNPADHEAQRPIHKKLRRMVQLNDRLLLRRHELQHSEQTLTTCGSFVAESADEVMQIFTSIIDDSNLELHRAQLQKGHSRLKADVAAFRETSSQIQNLRYNVAQDEARLKDRTQKLSNMLRATPFKLDFHSLEEMQEAEPDVECNTSSAPSTEESNTPTLLAQYYDGKGDIGIFQERLAELDYSFQEGLVEREMMQDRGDQLDLSDEEYRENYLYDRKVALDGLNKAEQKVAELKQECLGLGLKVGVHSNRSLSAIAFSISPDDFAAFHVPVAASDPIFRHVRISNKSSSSANRSQARVRTWLQTVTQDEPGAVVFDDDENKTTRLPMTECKRKAFRSWQPHRRQDVSAALASIELSTEEQPESSNLRMGLCATLRRWRSDPAYSHPVSQNSDRVQETKTVLPLRSTAEHSPEVRPHSIEDYINDEDNMSTQQEGMKATQTQAQPENSNWFRRLWTWRRGVAL